MSGNCVGLHPHGPCPPGVGCNAAPDPVGLRVAELEAENAELAGRVTALEETVRLTLEAVAFGHDVTLHSRLHRELLAVLNAGRPS